MPAQPLPQAVGYQGFASCQPCLDHPDPSGPLCALCLLSPRQRAAAVFCLCLPASQATHAGAALEQVPELPHASLDLQNKLPIHDDTSLHASETLLCLYAKVRGFYEPCVELGQSSCSLNTAWTSAATPILGFVVVGRASARY